MNSGVLNTEKTNFGVSPKKFTFWLFIATIVMMFASFTSGYVVRRAEGNWLQFNLPESFAWSIGIVIIGSIFVQLAFIQAKKNNILNLRLFLILTAISGLAFLGSQYAGWSDLVSRDIYYVGNPSASFVYVISAVHAAHIVASLLLVFYAIYAAFNHKIHSKSMFTIYATTAFWHFLGVLWIYLFVFLSLYR